MTPILPKRIMSCTITAVEFIRRFLLHTLSKGFVRIRHFGFLSNRHKTDNIEKIRKFLGRSAEGDKIIKQSIGEMMFKLTGIDITLCPCCKKGKMRVVFEIPKNTHPSIAEIIRPPNLRKAAWFPPHCTISIRENSLLWLRSGPLYRPKLFLALFKGIGEVRPKMANYV